MGEKNIVVQPAGRTEDPGARLWQIWLAVLLLGGTLLSFWDSWVDLGISPVIPMCLSLVTMALTLAAGWLRERDRRFSMLQLLPLLVLLGMLTVGSPWRGAKAWIDLLIAGWNREQNAGVALFAGQASLSDCLSVACWCSILCAELIGWMLRRRRTPFCSSYAFFLIIVMLLGGYFRPLAAALLVGGYSGLRRFGPVLVDPPAGRGGVERFLCVHAGTFPADACGRPGRGGPIPGACGP